MQVFLSSVQRVALSIAMISEITDESQHSGAAADAPDHLRGLMRPLSKLVVNESFLCGSLSPIVRLYWFRVEPARLPAL
jgi:hypothetical protein